MNFYIKNIQLWFRKDYSPKPNFIKYEFKPNKVNVITGDSSTGKSSILDIIDYCLLSDHPSIVEDIINENVRYYGMSYSINGRNYITVRIAPQLERASSKMYWIEADDYPEKLEFEQNVSEVKTELNRLFYIPQKYLKVGKKNVLFSYRHFLLFNYLTEDIISSANIYFDTAFFESKEYEDLLEPILEFANGIDSLRLKEATERLKQLEKDLDNYQKAHIKAEKSNREYLEELNSIFDKAASLNIVSNSNLFIKEDIVALKHYVQSAISTYDQLIKNDEQTENLEKLKNKRDKIKEKMNVYESLSSEVDSYRKQYNKTADSLKPINYIKDHIGEVIKYPETEELLNLLENALNAVQRISNVPSELPVDFVDRYNELKIEYKAIEDKLKELNSFRSKITNKLWLNNALDVKYRLKALKQPPKDDYSSSIEHEKASTIAILSDEVDKLSAIPNTICEDLNTSIKCYFDMQDGVSGSYKNSKTLFDLENRRLLLKKPGDDFPIKNVGSKSNYMFLHLCFFLGLHELLIKNASKQVPSFLFIDQPSIPYYADKQVLDSDDKLQLLKAFGMLNFFIERMTGPLFGKNFQIILIEHADKSYWKDLKHFHTTRSFIKEENGGLIPQYIYNEN